MGFLDGIRTAFYGNQFQQKEEKGLIQKSWTDLKASVSAIISSSDSTRLSPTITPTVAINKYRSWVYPCVNLISGKVATVPYYLYQEVGQPNDEEFNRILDHACVKLLKAPNKTQSGRMFKRIIQMHLDLCGCAFARILFNGLGQPAELHILNPHELFNIEFGSNTNEVFKKFIFYPSGNMFNRVELSYEEILYFHYPHPANPYAPCTPIQSLAHITDMDLYMEVYQKAFFLNDATPSFIIIPKGEIQEEEAQRISDGWFARHGGPGKAHKPAILSGDATIHQLAIAAKDFEFLALSEWAKDHILAAYTVPEAMLGLYESFNKASSITAETTFVKSCIEPRLNIFEDVVNHQLLPLFKRSSGLEFKHESALPKDDEWELAKDTGQLQTGLTTINEIRRRKGQKPFNSYKGKLCDIPWVGGQPIPGIDKESDDLWKEFSMGGTAATVGSGLGIPGMENIGQTPQQQGPMGELGGRPSGKEFSTLLNESLRASKPSLSMLLNAARGKRGGLASLLAAHPQMGSLGALLQKDRVDNTSGIGKLLTRGIYDYINESLEDDDKVVFKIYEENFPDIDNYEEEIENKIGDFYTKKGIETSNIVEKALASFVTKEPFDDIDDSEIQEEYKELIRDSVKKAIKNGIITGYKLTEKAAPNSDEIQQITIDNAGRYLDKSADLRVKSVKKDLTKILQNGIEEGLQIQDIAENIRTKFTDIGISRATMIARTEISSAMDVGLDTSYEKINKDAGKIIIEKALRWTSLTERVCEVCKEKHGNVVKNYETEEVFEEMILHPNCMCVRIPVMKK